MMETKNTSGDKTQRWQETAAAMTRQTDRLGQPIDPGILEKVVTLNLLGIHTIASCEEHLDWGTGAPCVDLEVEGVTQADEVSRLFEEAMQARAAGQPEEQWQAMFAEAHRLRLQVKAVYLRERRRLLDLLSAFYAERAVPYDVRLTLQAVGTLGRSRLESQGTDFQEVATPLERERKLASYQQEMADFTSFLKERYFQEQQQAAERPLDVLPVRDLRDTRGAASVLGARMGTRAPSVDTVHLLVKQGKLRAYVFNEDGVLAPRDEKQTRRAGQALYFDIHDLLTAPLPRESAGRPKKSEEMPK